MNGLGRNGQFSGFTLWLTGISGAGKSTIGMKLAAELRAKGWPVEILDGDTVRENLSSELGFSRKDRDANVQRIGFVANLLRRNGVCVIVASISPYRDARKAVRDAQADGRFVEIHVDCPLMVAIERDVKGMYRKAICGEIPNFTGVSDPYEAPLDPEIVVHTERESVDKSTSAVLKWLVLNGYVEHESALPDLNEFSGVAHVPQETYQSAQLPH